MADNKKRVDEGIVPRRVPQPVPTRTGVVPREVPGKTGGGSGDKDSGGQKGK